jgi:hypothetical protein
MANQTLSASILSAASSGYLFKEIFGRSIVQASSAI